MQNSIQLCFMDYETYKAQELLVAMFFILRIIRILYISAQITHFNFAYSDTARLFSGSK